MPAYMAHGSSSAGLSKIRRELERRRKLVAIAKGGVAKNSSAQPAPPPRSAPIPSAPGGAAAKKPSPAPIPHAPAGAATKRPSMAPISHAPAGAVAKKTSAPPPPPPERSASASISGAPRRESAPARTPPPPPPLPSSAASGSIKKGTTVRVRTRVGTLPTGQYLVLWLSAVVVSAAEDGHLEVIYKGDFPRDDPFRTVRVARDHVKNMPAHQ